MPCPQHGNPVAGYLPHRERHQQHRRVRAPVGQQLRPVSGGHRGLPHPVVRSPEVTPTRHTGRGPLACPGS
ncbi:hypothetical protein DVB88_02625 [Tsukamurella pulmonis]|nr:hypothetical protein DVB88_02625 [Tsukamurella pulmonis]